MPGSVQQCAYQLSPLVVSMSGLWTGTTTGKIFPRTMNPGVIVGSCFSVLDFYGDHAGVAGVYGLTHGAAWGGTIQVASSNFHCVIFG